MKVDCILVSGQDRRVHISQYTYLSVSLSRGLLLSQIQPIPAKVGEEKSLFISIPDKSNPPPTTHTHT